MSNVLLDKSILIRYTFLPIIRCVFFVTVKTQGTDGEPQLVLYISDKFHHSLREYTENITSLTLFLTTNARRADTNPRADVYLRIFFLAQYELKIIMSRKSVSEIFGRVVYESGAHLVPNQFIVRTWRSRSNVPSAVLTRAYNSVLTCLRVHIKRQARTCEKNVRLTRDSGLARPSPLWASQVSLSDIGAAKVRKALLFAKVIDIRHSDPDIFMWRWR